MRLSVYAARGRSSRPTNNQSRASERIAGKSLRTDRGHVFGGARVALLRVAAFLAAGGGIAGWRRRSGFYPGAADHPAEPGTRAVDLPAAIADGWRVVHGA